MARCVTSIDPSDLRAKGSAGKEGRSVSSRRVADQTRRDVQARAPKSKDRFQVAVLKKRGKMIEKIVANIRAPSQHCAPVAAQAGAQVLRGRRGRWG